VATVSGGAFAVIDNCLPRIVNCLITANDAMEGSAIYSYASDPKLSLCTIAGNTGNYANGLYNAGGIGNPTITSSIMWGNGAYPIQGFVNLSYSCIEGGHDGEGNIDQDPMFVSGPWGDYYLSCCAAGQESDSPCINAGTNVEPAEFNHKDYITRTDGIVDAGNVDMGFHYVPHLFFGLGIKPLQFGYEKDDEITLYLDLITAPAEMNADVYLLLLDPAGNFWSAISWNKGLQPLLSGYPLPADLDIEDAPIINFTIPSSAPPVDNPGAYTFYIAALNPGTTDFISNICNVGFEVK
jgi:hypothetical protein